MSQLATFFFFFDVDVCVGWERGNVGGSGSCKWEDRYGEGRGTDEVT